MKQWLIVLVPIILFGVLIATGVMKVPGINDGPPPKAKAAKKGDAGSKDAGSPTDSNSADPAPATDGSTPDPAPAAAVKPEPTAETVKPAADPAQAKPEAPKPTIDESKGDAKLAKIWNDMDATALVPIVDKWKDDDLVKVLAVMDSGKVVEILSAMKPDRASTLSKELQKQASIVPPTTP